MSSSQVPGTNAAPVSFPGIASGIDYNSIIAKLTSLTTAQNVTATAQIATLNAQNTELIKINGMLSTLQNSLGSVSDPSIFNAFSATSSNTAFATAESIGGSTQAAPGTYTVLKTQLATASSVTSNALAGHNITDAITAGTYAGQTSDKVPLSASYAAVTPSNGGGTHGTITIDGVQVQYNVNTDSVQTILSNINTAVQAVDAGFSATLNASGVVTFQSTDKPVVIGSASDQGNLLQVFKLSNAQVVNTATSGIVTGTSGVGGISQTAALNGTNAANFKTAVTSGTFTINGVHISVNAAGDNVASILAKINASSAGVTATYSADTNQITLNAKATGPQNIVVGAAGDTSNFLSAAALTSASGATSIVGSQASITLQTASGGSQTYYSNSNQITTAIPGVKVTLQGSTATPFNITVGQDTSKLITAVNGFVSAYNSVVDEINTATSPPVIAPVTPGSTLPGNASPPIGGGILWGNADVQSIRDRLTNLVTGVFGSQFNASAAGQVTYNSLASIGLLTTSSFTVTTTANNGTANNNGGTQASGTSATDIVRNTTYQGTDGKLQPLDQNKLLAALAANPSSVQSIFQGTTSLTYQLGTYLTGITGYPTLLNSGPVGNIPGTSVIQSFEQTNTNIIASLQDQIKRVTDNANAQADMLRVEFTSTEGQLAELQALQGQLSGFFKGNG